MQRIEPLRVDGELEALDLFESGDPPAFATDSWHRITLWNSGAERVLKRSAEEVMGKPCFEVLHGRDVYGNRYCYEKCPLFATVRRGEAAHAFDLVVGDNGEQKTLAVTTLQVPGRRPEQFTLVHILRQADDHKRLARLLETMGVAPPAPAAAGASEVRMPIEDPPLTPREREILRCVAAGLQNKEIAARLGISLATVRNHIHNILDKLEVHSKLEAVSLAFRRGWVDAAGA